MRFAKIFCGVFLGIGAFFVSSGFVSAQVTSCTHSGQSGSCVLSSSDCSNGNVYGGTECTQNNERTLCCILGGGGRKPCVASDDGSRGLCYPSNSCPNGQYYHRSLDCLGATPACCTSSPGNGGGNCPDTANHCKSNCTDYGGIKAGCDNACPAGTGNYYYCVSTTKGDGGQCPSLNSYCHSNCTNYGGEKSACSGACEGSAATRGLKYCNRSTTGGVDTSTGWTGGLSAIKDESGLPATSVKEIITGVLTWILAILGFIAIIGFVVAGILYLTAAGNTKQIETAKTAMTWSIIGVIVALMGYVIIKAADFFLRGSV